MQKIVNKKLVASIILCILFVLLFASKAMAAEVETEKVWVEKSVNGITYMESEEMSKADADAYKATHRSGGDSAYCSSYFAMIGTSTSPFYYPRCEYFRILMSSPSTYAGGTLYRNDSHAIIKHPNKDGYCLVWYEGTVYYE